MKAFHKLRIRSDRQCMDASQSPIRTKKEQATETETETEKIYFKDA